MWSLTTSIKVLSMEPYNRSSSFNQRLFWWINDNGVVNSQESNVVVASSLVGFKNPYHKSQIAAHEPATTACSGTARIFDPGYYEENNRYVLRFSGMDYQRFRFHTGSQFPPGFSFPVIPSVPPSLDNAALTRFLSSATSQVQTVNGSVFLGELHQTVRQLKHPFRGLVDLLQKREKHLAGRWAKLHRAKTVKEREITLRDLKHAVGDTWLEAQLGLQPLAGDISDILERSLFARFDDLTTHLPIRGAAVQRSKTNSTFWQSTNVGDYEFTDITETVLKVRYKGQVRLDKYRAGEINLDQFQRIGLDLRQFLPTLWEVTPWSFVIDYFANIGDLINGFNVPLSTIPWYNKTVRAEIIRTIQRTGRYRITNQDPTISKVSMIVASNRPGSMVTRQFQRSGGAGWQLPRPNIVFDLPSVKQWLNILALAQSKSKDLFRL